jgi:hypothetical protein
MSGGQSGEKWSHSCARSTVDEVTILATDLSKLGLGKGPSWLKVKILKCHRPVREDSRCTRLRDQRPINTCNSPYFARLNKCHQRQSYVLRTFNHSRSYFRLLSTHIRRGHALSTSHLQAVAQPPYWAEQSPSYLILQCRRQATIAFRNVRSKLARIAGEP